ncbi:ATPase, partial [Streptomyces sp. SID4931]|nr:ATPase [Streptomyces sp. SID4931]
MTHAGPAGDPAGPGAYVLGVDSGGSGLRVALGRVEEPGPLATTVCAEPVRTGPGGIDAGHLLDQLLPAARELLDRASTATPTGAGSDTARALGTPADGASAGAVAAVAIGAAGMATLGDR